MKSPLPTLALLLGLAAGLGLTQTAAAVTPSERAALIHLFGNTNPPPGNGLPGWNHQGGWLTQDPDECTWFGVICDSSKNLVGLNLSNNNLTNRLPDLTGLEGLITFNVSDNLLGGPISVLTQLKNLSALDVSGNQLTGPIPSLNSLTHLQEFNAASNKLNGSVPALAGLDALVIFNATGNRLTGILPPLTGLTRLRALNVSNNQLTGTLSNLAQASSLEDVDMSANFFQGTLPALNGLTHLRKFKIDRNGLSGVLPAAPASLVAGGSNLCPNPLVAASDPPSAIDKAWNAATAETPAWSNRCTTHSALVEIFLHPDSPPVDADVNVQFFLTPLNSHGAPSGKVTVVDDLDSSATCVADLVSAGGEQSTGNCTLRFASVGTHTLTALYPGDGTFAPGAGSIVVVNSVLENTELGALNDLFRGTDGEHWTHRNNWITTGDPCSAVTPWFGVTCTADRTHVLGIDLHDNKLTGVLNNAVERLPRLRSLNISGNQLSGSFPDLSGLADLQFVLADHNRLSGQLRAPPASLTAGASNLCPNALSPATNPPSAIDLAWNAATGANPWSKDCIQRTVKISVNTSPNPAHIGDAVTVDITIAPVSGGGIPTGNVTVSGNVPPQIICEEALSAGKASCLLQFPRNGVQPLTIAYEGDDLFVPNSATTFQIIEALPDSERQVLDELFLFTDGTHWSNTNGWPHGVSCSRFGVTCDFKGTHVLGIELNDNNLSGSLPSLSPLVNLETFDVGNNQLHGAIPSLHGLKFLQTFIVVSNQLTGSIPDLAGLANLHALDVRNNRLTGAIPALTDLANLQFLFISQNGLSGLLPAPPPAQNLLTSLCPNPLTPAADPPSANDLAWNAITHSTPWSKSCVLSSAQVAVSANPNPVQSGNAVAVAVTVAPVAGGTGTPDGTVTVADSLDLDASCTLTLKDGSGICALILVNSGTHTLTAGYSGSLNLSPGSGTTTVKVIMLGGGHTIGGVVSGLVGSGLVLSLNAGAQTLAIPASTNGGFAFPTQLADGSSYAVTVLTQPTAPTQTCTVANGSGTLAGEDVFTVAVNCSAVAFTVTPQAGPFGRIDPSTAQVVAAGATASFTLVPDAGHVIAAVSGCGGGLSSANVYTTAPISADCTVTASFSAAPVNGVCGADNGLTLPAPPVRLCSAGTPSAVIGSGPFSWTCVGSNGGSTASCSANLTVVPIKTTTATTLNLNPNPVAVNADVTASVSVTTSATGANQLSASLSSHLASLLSAVAAAAPTGTVQVSDGTVSCTASPSGNCTLRFATPGVHAVTATYSGDANFAASSVTINETVNAVVQNNAVQAPTLSEWLLDLLGITLGGIALLNLRRRTAPRFRQ